MNRKDLFKSFLQSGSSWFCGEGPDSDIIFSSRVRLARNLRDIPFPNRAEPGQKREIIKAVRAAGEKILRFRDNCFLQMPELSELERSLLAERHLISREHAAVPEGKAVLVSDDEQIYLMINEEDHMRLQLLGPGFSLEKSWQIINKLDNELSRFLSFAFLPEFGYLTCCPTNAGTGLRASCMLHLPALVLSKRIDKILELLSKLSFTARGLFGEGTQALGNFFQISNQVTLGLGEEELVDNLSGIVLQVKEQEEQARQMLLRKYKFTVEDKIWRALGIMRQARLMTTSEAFSHLSMLYLGIDLGIIKRIKREVLNNLFISIQPAHLQQKESKLLREEARDFLRASLLRGSLGG